MSICGYCFCEYSGNICPNCNFAYEDQAEKYPQALRPGTILGGQYLIGHVLGQGGFGITYIAQDYNSKQLVAIKEFMPEQFAARSANNQVSLYSAQHENDFIYGKENFLSEAKTLSQFNGLNNICDIYTYFEENGTAYFAMEYVDGISLSEHMRAKGGRLTFEEAKQLLFPIMQVLAGIHAKGIIHRDIAPDNIMVTNEGKPMLIDFGAARYSLGEKSRSLDVILKHGFAPKEQYTRRGRQGPYTDVYAMAATFYYATTGKIPPEAVDRMGDEELILPSALGAKIGELEEDVLLKALSVEASARFQTMNEFVAAFSNEKNAIPVAVTTKSEAPERKHQKSKNTKPLYAALAAAVFALIVVGAFFLGKGSSDEAPKAPKTTTQTNTSYSVEIDGKTYHADSQEEIDKIIQEKIYGSINSDTNSAQPSNRTHTSLSKDNPMVDIVGAEYEGFSYNYHRFYFKVTNISNINIKILTININILDKNGDVVSTTHPQEQATIKPGQSIYIDAMSDGARGAIAATVDSYSFYDENENYFSGEITISPVVYFE